VLDIQTSDPSTKITTMDLLRQLDETLSPGLLEDVFIGLSFNATGPTTS
jgi:hypothetical protein